MSKSLAQHLERLAETLEDNPDPWFNDPKGYLKKPRFGRPAQEKTAIAKGTTFTNVLGSGYQMRWFVLDVKRHKLSYYGSDDPKAAEKGSIDLKEISDVIYSKVFDAPEFSLDLVGTTQHYTLVADSHASMLRWAFALNLALPQSKLSEEINLDIVFDDPQKKNTMQLASRWFEYQVMYEEEGPLMLNVVGMVNRDKDGRFLNNLVAVTSFENYPDGTPGVSESTGMISVKDYIIGVNSVDLTKLTFNEALEKIAKASWPKTLHFIRDNLSTRDVSRCEGWAIVYYPSLNRRRRRYLELVHETINFKKVEPGGAASNARDAYFRISQINYIRPVHDKTVAAEQQYTLHLVCHSESLINHVDECDVSQGGTFLDSLELCFPNLREMNKWRSALVSPIILHDGKTLSLQAMNLETIEHVDVNPISMATKIAIKLEATGFFAPREFTLTEGCLRWKRVAETPKNGNFVGSSNKDFKGSKGRSLFIGNAAKCNLKSLRMIKDPKKDISGYEYQLVVETKERVLIMGMKDELALTQWMHTIKDTALLSPLEERRQLVLPSSIELVHLTNTYHTLFGNDEDKSISTSSVGGFGKMSIIDNSANAATSGNTCQGFLYLKQEKSAFGFTSEGFKKRWFVLNDYTLSYYKSEAYATKQPLGSFDLKEVYAVRESSSESAPENSIDLNTANRTFLLVAEDEEEQVKWLDILGDKLEERRVAAQREDAFQAVMGLPKAQKMEAMKRIVQFCGRLHKKNGSIWKERFFVLANRCLTYYSTEDEFYDDYKDSLGVIPLSNITQVNSSSLEKCRHTGFEVHAYATRGERDARGIRVFTFNAHLDSLCKEWMTAICEATGNFELRDVSANKDTHRYMSVAVTESYGSKQAPPNPNGNNNNNNNSSQSRPTLKTATTGNSTSSTSAPSRAPSIVGSRTPSKFVPQSMAPPPVSAYEYEQQQQEQDNYYEQEQEQQNYYQPPAPAPAPAPKIRQPPPQPAPQPQQQQQQQQQAVRQQAQQPPPPQQQTRQQPAPPPRGPPQPKPPANNNNNDNDSRNPSIIDDSDLW